MINSIIPEKHRGNNFVAVTQYGDKYSYILKFNKDELNKEIFEQSRTFISRDYKVLARFDGVDDRASNIVDDAVTRLSRGNKVDLGKLLTG